MHVVVHALKGLACPAVGLPVASESSQLPRGVSCHCSATVAVPCTGAVRPQLLSPSRARFREVMKSILVAFFQLEWGPKRWYPIMMVFSVDAH